MDKPIRNFNTRNWSYTRRRRMAVSWAFALLFAWLVSLVVAKPVAAQSEITPGTPCFSSTNLTNLSVGGERGITNQPVISGNGERVAFWSVNGFDGGNADGNIEIFVRETGSASVVQLTRSVGSILGGFNLEPSISADGTHIAFYSDRDLVVGQNSDGNFEIFLARRASSGAWSITQITNTEGSANLFPSINSAGDRIAFVSDDSELHNIDLSRVNADRNFEIFLAEIPGSGDVQFRQVTNSGAGVTNDQPVIDAAGNRIAFTAATGQTAQVFVWDRSQGAPVQLTQTDVNDQPSISADGSSIVYIATNATSNSSRVVLHTLSADGSESRAEVIVPAALNTKYRGPSVSGNGERVVYVAEQVAGAAIQINVLLYDGNAGLSVPISVAAGTGEQPAISSDGTRVTYVGVLAVGGSTDNTGSDIYLNECPQGDLVLEFLSPPATQVLAGNDVSYQFRVTNRGPSVAKDVFIRSEPGTLPANVSFILPAGCTFDANGVLVCELGDLGVNESRDFTFGYDIPSNAGLADIVSEIEVGANIVDINLTNNGSGSFTTSIFEEAALTLQVTTNRSSMLAGSPDQLIYDLLVTNAGPSQGRSARITNTLPAGAVLQSFAIVQGGGAGANCPAPVGNVVACDLGNLTAGSSTLVRIVVTSQPSVVQNFSNVATVRSLTQESNLADNTIVTTTTVERSSDMSITKKAHASSVVAGREITYTITNNGFADTLDVVVIDTLSQFLSYVRSDVPVGASCLANAAAVTCTFPGELLVNQSVTFGIVALVASDAPTTPIGNTASVHSGRADPTPANNISPAVQTAVTRLADLGVTKTVSKNLPDVGEQFAYTVKVRNDGPSQALDVIVTDVLASALDLVSAPATVGSYASGVWTVGTLSVGQEQTLTIHVTAKETAGGQIVANTATASSSVTELEPGLPNSASVNVTPQRADMQIGMVSLPTPASKVVAGKPLTYTLSITNAGPTLARSVTLSNVLPDNSFFVSVTPSAGCSGVATITCNVGDMANGATVNYTVVITHALAGMITSTASVSSLTPELTGQSGNNSASHSIQVVADVPNKLEFEGPLPTPIQAGQLISPVVRILDRFNNLVEETVGFTDTILLEPYVAVGAPCTNPGDTSALINAQVDAINGIATFNDLTYTKAESIQLWAIDIERPGVTPACSTVIDVNPADVKQLHIVSPAYTLIAGEISAGIVISRTDEFTNDKSVGIFTVRLINNAPSTGNFLKIPDANPVNTITTVQIPNGSVTVTVYFTETIAGNYLIAAEGPIGSDVVGATQAITVTAAAAQELLVVITAPLTTTAGISSDLFTVQRVDRFNNPNSSDGPVTVNLKTDPFSPAGVFRNDADTQTVTQVIIPFGSSIAQFRYQDTLAATHSISITDALVDPLLALKGDIVTITVVPSTTAKLEITSTAQIITAGVPSGMIRVVRQDFFGNNNFTDPNLLVNLDSLGGGVFEFRNDNEVATSAITILQNSDYAEFDYSNELAATFTIMAASSGKDPASHVITVTPDLPFQLEIITTTSAITAGAPPFTITIQRQDQFGNASSDDAAFVTFPSTTSPKGTFSNADNSEATEVTIPANETNASVRYTDTKASNWVLAFNNGLMPTFYVSQTLSVTADDPTKLVYLQKPTSVTAGQKSTIFEVQRQDVFDNAYSGPDPLTVHLTSTSTGNFKFINGFDDLTEVREMEILGGTSTIIFKYNDNRAGTHLITAYDMGGLTPATGTITVTAAAASKTVLTNTAIVATAGITSSLLTVQVQDEFNNPVTQSVELPLYIDLGTTADRPPFRFVNMENTAVITRVVLAGSSTGSFRFYDEKASTDKVISVNNDDASGVGGPLTFMSQGITVLPNVTKKIAFTTLPLTLSAGVTTTVGMHLTVQRQDQFGNPTFDAADRVLNLASSSVGPKRFISALDPATVLPAQVTILSGQPGASFRYYDEVRGQPVITVTTDSTGLTTSIIEQTQNVLGDVAVRFKLTGVPAQVVAGEQQQLTITALDKFGNRSDPYTGPKTLIFDGAGPGPGGNPPTVTNNSSGSVAFGPSVNDGTVLTFTAGLLQLPGGSMTLYDAANGVVITAQDTAPPNISTAGGGALTVDVLPNALHRVRAETVSGGEEVGVVVPPTTVVPNAPIDMWAVGRDQYGNTLGNIITATWHLTATEGVNAVNDLVTDFAKATFTGHLSGTAVIEPRAAGAISVPTGKITVTAGTADFVHVELAPGAVGSPAMPVTERTLTAGDPLLVYAVVRDSVGNFKRNQSATWTIVTPTLGVSGANLIPAVGASTVFSAQLVGTGYIRASIGGGSTSVDSGKITVQHGAATQFAVGKTPAGPVDVDVTQTFSITAVDVYNNVVLDYNGEKTLTFTGAEPSRAPQTHPIVVDNLQSDVYFGQPTKLVFNQGTFRGTDVLVAPRGQFRLYHAPFPDAPVVILVTAQGAPAITGTLSVNVIRGPANRIAISAPTDTLMAGSGVSLTLTAEDVWGNRVPGYGGPKTLIFSGDPNPNVSGFPKATVSKRSPFGLVDFDDPTQIEFTNGQSATTSGNNGVMTLYKAAIAPYNIRVQENGGGLPSGLHGSKTFTVTPSTSEVMKLDLASPQVNRAPFVNTNVFTLTDIYNNPVMPRDVTFTTSLPGTLTIDGDNVINVAGGSAVLTGMTYTGPANATGVFTATAVHPLGGTVSVTDTVYVSHTSPSLIQFRGATTTDDFAPSLVITAGQPISLLLRLVDVDGNAATGVTNPALPLKFTVTLAPSTAATVSDVSGAAIPTNLGTDTNLNFIGGLANVTPDGKNGMFSLVNVGTYTLTAVGPSLATQTGQELVVNVEPGPAYTLTLSLDGMTQVNNFAFSGLNTIQVFDQHGNPVTNFGSGGEVITLSVTSPVTGVVTIPGSLGGPTWLAGADFGITNTVDLNTKGLIYAGLADPAVIIRATLHRADGSIVFIEDTVNVRHSDTLHHYVLSIDDTPAAAGSALASSLVAKDLWGNVVLNHAPAALSFNFEGGQLAPDLTTPKIDQTGEVGFTGVTLSFTNGQADFSVKLYNASPHTIRVEQGGIYSNDEAVTVLPAAHTVFEVIIDTTQTLTNTFTELIAPAKLTAMDEYSNVVTTFNTTVSNVNVTIESSPVCLGVPLVRGFNDSDVVTPSVMDDLNDFASGVADLVGGVSNNGMKVFDGCPGSYQFRFQRADNAASGLSEFIQLVDP